VAGGLVHLGFFGEATAADHSMRVYIGTYTGGQSLGIYLSRFDPKTGRLTTPELAAQTPNPTFLALHPNGRFLYAANEISDFHGKPEGAVSAFSVDPSSGKLTLLNQESSSGGGPCHLAVDRTGKCLLVANYGSGSVAALPLRDDGRLGGAGFFVQHHGSSINPDRQSGPHAHFITPDPSNQFALACDLGLDKVLIYRMDPARPALAPNDPPWISVKAGSGPRHLAFNPNGRLLCLINEMGCTLTSYDYDAHRGELKEVQSVSTLPQEFKGQNTCAEVQFHPSGKFVYGSNRGHNSIVLFAIEPNSGRLSFIECQSTQGKTPRHFSLEPDGRWMLVENQDSDNIVVFQVDPGTGRLKPTGEMLGVGKPVCVVWLPQE
jgi:6-phosphogluconolactonase